LLYTTPHTSPSDYILETRAENLDQGSKSSDRVLLVCTIFLMVFGLLAVYSSIAYFAEANNQTASYYLMQHAGKLGIAFFIMILASKLDYHYFTRFSHAAVIFSWLLLIFAYIFGNEVFGARRWISLGPVSFQPSSLAMVALLFHISVLLQQKQEYIKNLSRSFMPVFIWVSVTCLLIAIEDLSTAGVVFMLSIMVMFVGRISLKHLFVLFMFGGLVGSALIYASPERQSRINEYVDQITHINSTQFDRGEGYQAQQAHIAIARGELLGVGIGKSTQRSFLPAPYNDFIFAIIAEEYGLIGSLFVILIFTVILVRGIVYIARDASDLTGTLLATAYTLALVMYGFINAGVASGLLPVTGLPMPFVSYGGSNLIFAGLMVGVLLNISRNIKRPELNISMQR